MHDENFINYECYNFCFDLWKQKYNIAEEIFEGFLEKYQELKSFGPNENIFESGQEINEYIHFIMKCVTQFYLTKAFEAMKLDLTNPNIAANLEEGNKGSPARLAKVFCGSDINDDRELGSGRWSKKPRMARFPNDNGSSITITKRVDIISSCSHHF